jgi:hypothetical protein
MFGQDDQNDDISTVNPTLNGSDTSTPAVPDTPAVEPAAAPTSDVAPTAQAVLADSAATEPTPAVAPAEAAPAAAPAVETTPTPAIADPTPAVTPATGTDETALLALKKQALEELSPLLGELDQTPEEKFKTTMMMIQATDSSALVTSAHEAALQITDEKVRAQALLDIVNEINYFTQPKE